MEQFILSEQWVQAIGATLLHSIWQGFIILFITHAIFKINRHSTPAFRYHLSFASLFGLVLWMSTTFYHQLGKYAENIQTIAPTDGQFIPDLSFFQNDASWQDNMELYLTQFIDLYANELVFIWFIGIFFFSLKWLGAFYYTQLIKRKYIQPPLDKWQLRVKQLSYDLGIDKTIRIMESTKVDVPMVIGYIKPVILIPTCAFTGFTPQQLEHVIIHELAHIKHHDFLMNLILSALEVILFYHPAYWYLARIISLERENRCDDLVVSHVGNPRQYAETLFNMEKIRQQHSLGMSLQGNKNQLLDRIKRICLPHNHYNRGRMHYSGFAFVLLFVLAIISAAKVPLDAKSEIWEPMKKDLNAIMALPYISDQNDKPIITENDTDEVEVADEESSDWEENTDWEEIGDDEEISEEEEIVHLFSSRTPAFPQQLDFMNTTPFNFKGLGHRLQSNDTLPFPTKRIILKTEVDDKGDTRITFTHNGKPTDHTFYIKGDDAKLKINGKTMPKGNHEYVLDEDDEYSLNGRVEINTNEDVSDKFHIHQIEGDFLFDTKEGIEILEGDGSVTYKENPLFPKKRKDENIFFSIEKDDPLKLFFNTDDLYQILELDEFNNEITVLEKTVKNKELSRLKLQLDELEGILEKKDAITNGRDEIIQQKEILRAYLEEINDQKRDIKEVEEHLKAVQAEALAEKRRIFEEYKLDIRAKEEELQLIIEELKATNFDNLYMGSFHESLLEELKKDGIIRNKKKVKIHLDEKKFKVNGKKQPKEVHAKYLRMYEDHSNKAIGPNTNFELHFY